MLVLRSEKASGNELHLKKYEGESTRLTVSHTEGLELTGFILSTIENEKECYCLEWSERIGFHYYKKVKRSSDVIESETPELSFSKQKYDLVYEEKDKQFIDQVKSKLTDYQNQCEPVGSGNAG